MTASDGTTTITVKPSDSLAGYYIGAEANTLTSPAAGKELIDIFILPMGDQEERTVEHQNLEMSYLELHSATILGP